jgi:hypothetical protein
MGLTLSKNGRLYPSSRSSQELARIRVLVHELRCGEGLSLRQVRKRLMDHHVWRSLGSISADLSRFECDLCATSPAAPEPAPGPAVAPEVTAWR